MGTSLRGRFSTVSYVAIFGSVGVAVIVYHLRRRKRLSEELAEAKSKLQFLEEKLLDMSTRYQTRRDIRIFMDGAFDLLHFGHMNAFRLARSLGTRLVVGVNSDESITQCKGAPLMNDEERLTMVAACKFVDEVVPDCPYIMNKEYLDYVIDKYKIDYVVHGDDPCIVDGKDVYATAKEAGKYRSIPRTEGVSTTDIVGRMLLMTKEHHFYDVSNGDHPPTAQTVTSSLQSEPRQSKFLTTSRMLKLFSADVKAPVKGMRVIYMDGAWDLFHPGHVAILKEARERGNYLIVGVHGDALVNKMKGINFPLMNLHERVLSVLGCRYVSDVVIDAPYALSPEMIASLSINEVVHGTLEDEFGLSPEEETERYKSAIEAGIYVRLTSPTSFSIKNIFERVRQHQQAFQDRFERKMGLEREFYRNKHSNSDADSGNSR